MTTAERSQKFKAAQRAKGLAQFNVWIPAAQHPEFRALVEFLAANPSARIVSVATQDAETGRMRGVRLS